MCALPVGPPLNVAVPFRIVARKLSTSFTPGQQLTTKPIVVENCAYQYLFRSIVGGVGRWALMGRLSAYIPNRQTIVHQITADAELSGSQTVFGQSTQNGQWTLE